MAASGPLWRAPSRFHSSLPVAGPALGVSRPWSVWCPCQADSCSWRVADRCCCTCAGGYRRLSAVEAGRLGRGRLRRQLERLVRDGADQLRLVPAPQRRGRRYLADGHDHGHERQLRNFTRDHCIGALCDFYRGPGAKYEDAARDFFKQHPGSKAWFLGMCSLERIVMKVCSSMVTNRKAYYVLAAGCV